MTRTQQLQVFMEAVELQQNLDALREKRKLLRERYLSASVHEGTKILEDWMRLNDIIENISSDLFSILSCND